MMELDDRRLADIAIGRADIPRGVDGAFRQRGTRDSAARQALDGKREDEASAMTANPNRPPIVGDAPENRSFVGDTRVLAGSVTLGRRHE